MVPLRREFVLANYAELKKANPALPILIRESAGAEAKLVARYGAGMHGMALRTSSAWHARRLGPA